jgi:NADH-quinone oxidoreductase subunit J
MPGVPIVFFILAAVAVVTALGTIISRNAIYAALFLVMNFATIAVMYLTLHAPFIALSQITVYAGSIMVLFLFVIMLLGAERLPQGESLRWQPWLAIPLALILAGAFAYTLFRHTGQMTAVGNLPANFGSPQSIGQALFSQYALPFEITAVILMVAVVGAIMLAKPDRPSGEAVRRGKPAVVTAPTETAPTETAPNEAAPTESAPAAAGSAAAQETPAAEQENVMNTGTRG